MKITHIIIIVSLNAQYIIAKCFFGQCHVPIQIKISGCHVPIQIKSIKSTL